MTEQNYKVLDNFLDKNIFYDIQKVLLGPDFPWYYNSTKVENMENNIYSFQFVHSFYRDHAPSQSCELIYPIIEKINPLSLVRVKGNLTTVTSTKVEYGYHTDYNNPPTGLKTAVFYINTNNGETIFEDGTRIESLENRLVIFDTPIVHTGTSCTDSKTRVVLNFNFFEY